MAIPIFNIGAGNVRQADGTDQAFLQIFNDAKLHFSGAIDSTQPSGQGVAYEPLASDAIRYVSANGNASNDGLSWGTALYGTDVGAAINSAYASLPATGGIINLASGIYNFSTPIVLDSLQKPVWVIGQGGGGSDGNKNPLGSTILKFTPSTGVALTIQGSSGMRIAGFALQGSATGTAQGISLTDFIFSTLSDLDISGFFGGGLVLNSNTYVCQFNRLTIHDNNDIELLVPSNSTNLGERVVFFECVFTEKHSNMSETAVNIQTGSDYSFISCSFDQAGVTYSNTGEGNQIVFIACHFENPNGSTNSDFFTMAATNANALMYGCIAFEDTASTRTEFFKVTGTSSELNLVGGQFNAAQVTPNLINCSGSDTSGGALGIRTNGNFTAITTSFFYNVLASRGTFALGGAITPQLNGPTSSTATAGGGVALPATVVGFLEVNLSGTVRKIPFYAA